MTGCSEEPTAEQDRLAREARAWLTLLTSGQATAEDAARLKQWRAISPAHRKAFAEANLLWSELGPAIADSVRRKPLLSEELAAGRAHSPSRRLFLGGSIAAATAAGVYAVLRPPFELWPSLTDLTADYVTGVGQQRQVDLDGNAQVKLNTRTAVTMLAPDDHQSERIELLKGEAAFATRGERERPFVVVAALGQTTARNARFNIRYDDASVCVTCLEGEVRVEHLDKVTKLAAREQVAYTSDAMNEIASADPEVVSAWEKGLLLFRNDPLSRVIEEVNRYRTGKIILMNEDLGRRTVVATFRIDRIEEVVPHLKMVLGVRTRTLPGGFVLMG